MSPRLKSLLIITSFVMAIVGTAACSGDPASSPASVSESAAPSPTPINPRVLLRDAGKVMEDLNSFAFRLEHESGVTPIGLGIALEAAEGKVVKPDKLRIDFRGTLGSIFIKSSIITLGANSFMLNPVSGRWETIAAEVSPLGFFNPREGIAAMMSQVEGASLVSSDREVHLIRGILPAVALSPLLGETVTGTTVDAELKIDVDRLFLIEALIEGRVTEAEPDGVIRVITLSQFNEPFTINPPQ